MLNDTRYLQFRTKHGIKRPGRSSRPLERALSNHVGKWRSREISRDANCTLEPGCCCIAMRVPKSQSARRADESGLWCPLPGNGGVRFPACGRRDLSGFTCFFH